jgi:hypothetical protein
MRTPRLLLALLTGTLLAACDSGPSLRAYPGLLDLPAATVAEVRTTAPVPGRYNVRATVVAVGTCTCPPGAFCFAPCPPDGVLLSASGAPRPPGGAEPVDPNFLYVDVEGPERFEVGRRYALSIEVAAGVTQPALRHAVLLGYEGAD